MNDRVTVEVRGGVADVRMVRVDKMNALDRALHAALIEAGERLKTERGLRAAVLSGEGRAFCAGIDTGSLDKVASGGAGAAPSGSELLPEKRWPSGANDFQQAVMTWRELPVPVIAAVHGVAFGGGFQLALGPDLRFVTPDVRLSVMEIKWGLVPDMGGIALLRGLVRDDVARDLTYTGRQFSGEEALALGLATRVCADPRAEALAYAAEIAAKNPHAIRAAKRLLNQAADADGAELLLAESREQAALMASPNQVEAIAANMLRRPPAFSDV
ncbi:MAG: crotonase/enoyl-CoA hydratase family protein [Caulobacteraceae bacterium]|nr:crotonase/enoyl-CoA hydratase family protein [Caulobacteraceae bacterium]